MHLDRIVNESDEVLCKSGPHMLTLVGETLQTTYSIKLVWIT